jgi:hypothetical protein
MTKVLELFGLPTHGKAQPNWAEVVAEQHCPFLARKCLKNRKSEPDIAIGTCTVKYGKDSGDMIICPFRLLERRQIFTDCLHLLTMHEPGNELHVITELHVPGGSVDYCLVSVRNRKAIDVCGIELQTLDTTGTVWPERQRFLHSHGISTKRRDRESAKPFGMNWKMTAKTILIQLHHKVETFEQIGKHLVLVIQNHLLGYMRKEFSFGHLEHARTGDPMHFHGYKLVPGRGNLRLQLDQRWSTDTAGIARCLGMQTSSKVELGQILAQVEEKLSGATLLAIVDPPPTSELAANATDPS